MPKQTLVFENKADLSLKDGQLLICQEGKDPIMRSLEDVSGILVDNHSVRITVPLLNKLAQNNISMVFCDERHMPVSMTLDLESNVRQTMTFNAQLATTEPVRKQIWKQIVEHKIHNQSLLLQKLGKGDDVLSKYHKNVKSGDTTNREALAAAAYWKLLLGKDFIRDRYGSCPNDMLNYGYAILRSVVSRALMNSGLLPMIGVFHKNRYNSFPLSDDVIEPYRPFIDEKVIELYTNGQIGIDHNFKKAILELFYDSIKPDDVSQTTYSLSQIYLGERRVIYYPSLV